MLDTFTDDTLFALKKVKNVKAVTGDVEEEDDDELMGLDPELPASIPRKFKRGGSDDDEEEGSEEDESDDESYGSATGEDWDAAAEAQLDREREMDLLFCLSPSIDLCM